MDEKQVVEALQCGMKKAIEVFEQDLAGLRTGRANVALLDKVTVEVYGAKTPLKHVATLSVLEARVLGVNVWDAGNIRSVEKAIAEAINITPVTEGNNMKIMMPDLSDEVRKDLIKMASTQAERARVGLRNIRREAIDSVRSHEKKGDLSEDESRKLQNRITKETNTFVEKVDVLLTEKEKRIQMV
ncbi:MAG: ribosome recycling factor [Alphaproteobacteria bacterium]|nr:ribosome recycling factor [Alphaproteobacteria bacterium]